MRTDASAVGAVALSTEAAADAVAVSTEMLVDAPASSTETELVVAPVDPVIAATTEEVRFSVLVRHHTAADTGTDTDTDEQSLPGGTLQLWMGAERLTSLEALDAFPATQAAVTADLIGELEVAPTPVGEEQLLEVVVPREALPALTEAGVYGVRAELHSSDVDVDVDIDAENTDADGADIEGSEAPGAAEADEQSEGQAEGQDQGAAEAAPVSGSTQIVWRGVDGGAQVPVAMVVPFVLPESVQTMPTREELSAEASRLDALLTAAEEWQATLAIDPRLIAGIRASGTSAPAAARNFLARLEATTLPTFLLQFADADPAAQADLGAERLLQPIGLSYVTRLGTFEAPKSSATSNGAAPTDADSNRTDSGDTAADSRDPDTDSNGTATDATGTDSTDSVDAPDSDPDEAPDPAAPGIAELLSWPNGTATAWPADGRANAATLDLLQRSGLTSLVLSSTNVAGATAPRATVSGFDAIIADARLGSAAARAMGADAHIDRDAGTATLAAELAIAASAASSGVALALDRGVVADAAAPAELLGTLATYDWVAPVVAAELPAGEAVLAGGTASDPQLDLLRAQTTASAEIDELSPLLEHPGYLRQYQRIRLLTAYATRYAAADADIEAVQGRFDERNAELLLGVQALPSENTQLVGTQSRVPVLLHNALPFDARVTLRVAPTSAAIEVPERRFPAQAIAAGGNTTVLVPVSSRVSSGDSGLVVQVADLGDDAVYSSAMLRLTLRSSYETIMLVALGSLAAVLLGFGVWRSVRRHRRPAETAAAADPVLPSGDGE